MELHPLRVLLYATGDFKFLSKDDFRVCKQVLNFVHVKMVCLSNIFFSLIAKVWEKFPLFWTKSIGFSSFLLSLLIVLRCCSFLGGSGVSFSFVTILSNVSLTKPEGHSVGYWFSAQMSWFFLRAISKDCQSLVALKVLCTVPWITFFLF